MAIVHWRDRLRPGSFRGVPAFLDSADQELGRRIVLHEYPLRSNPYPEDMGRKARTYNLSLFVIGADYMTVRDDMIDALEMRGPGTLVHPYRGQLRVVVTAARVAESHADGGMARFTITFVEHAENIEPAAIVDTSDAVEKEADDAEEFASAEFAEAFSVKGMPQFGVDSALKQLNGVLTGIIDLRMQLTPDLSVLNDAAALANNLGFQIIALLSVPGNLAKNLTNLYTSTVLTAETSLAAARSILNHLAGRNSSASTPVISSADTPTRKRVSANSIAVARYEQRLYLIQTVRCAARADYASRDEAIALRDQLIDLVEAELQDPNITADTHQSFTRMMTALITDVATRSARLSRVSTITLREMEPALVTAYAVYGSVARVDELIDRNSIEHPAFMPAGVKLEVLLA